MTNARSVEATSSHGLSHAIQLCERYTFGRYSNLKDRLYTLRPAPARRYDQTTPLQNWMIARADAAPLRALRRTRSGQTFR